MNRISTMVNDVISLTDENYVHPLLEKREIKKTAYLVITSDKGLAGAYNSSIYKTLDEVLNNNHSTKKEFICASIGKKGFNHISKSGYPLITDKSLSIKDDVMFMDIEGLASQIIDMYLTKKIDKLVIIYNHFIFAKTNG